MDKKQIQLSDHFTYGRLLRFALPSIVMLVFTSIYTVVDGLFVSNIVGSNALSCINIVMPILIVIGAFGFMLGTGGSAEVARTLGEGNKDKANEYFSMIIIVITLVGVVLTAIVFIFIRPICYFLGASELLIDGCVTYGRIILIGGTFYMLQANFQTFFVTAEKPKLGLILTVVAGVINAALDFVFIYVFQWGLAGAAAATAIGCFVGGVVPIIYFMRKNNSLLRLTGTKFYPRTLLNSCTNGCSEMMSECSSALITFLYNYQMMKLVGEAGVAAITVIMYVNFIFVSIFIGYVVGTSPIVGYHYGAGNKQELKNVYKMDMRLTIGGALIMMVLAELLARPLVGIFLNHEPALADFTTHGFRIFALAFIGTGINIFASSFFTALCNGLLSALIAFLRTLILQSGMILLLPMFLDVEGIWLAVLVAEVITVGVSIFLLRKNRKRYGY